MSRRYLECLDNNQKNSVTSQVDRPLIMYAGPGFGKTRTLISRIAFLLENYFQSKQILVLTCTRKAASEIRERLINYVGPESDGISVCTFHEFCYQVLKDDSNIVGLEKDFKVASGREQYNCLKVALGGKNPKDASTHEIKSCRYFYKEILS